jgi:hypothetical protein
VLPMLEASIKHGIEVIWDLFHFGWREYLDIFEVSWVEAFVQMASGFAQVLRQAGFRRPVIAPVNEPSFTAWAGGDEGCLNPFATCR